MLIIWKIFLSLWFIAVAVPLLVSFGWVVTTMNNPKFTAAQIVFSICALILLVRSGWGLVYELEGTRLQLIIGAIIIFGVIDKNWVYLMKWVNDRESKFNQVSQMEKKQKETITTSSPHGTVTTNTQSISQAAKKKFESKKESKPQSEEVRKEDDPFKTLTLIKLFEEDFSDCGHMDNYYNIPTSDEVANPNILVRIFLDFKTKSKFIGFYIPASQRLFELCEYLANNCENMMKIMETKSRADQRERKS
ncbi:MAG: hypothetical protein ABSB79_15590 [Syntrophales bacterium]|jgi:hypothetical protein